MFDVLGVGTSSVDEVLQLSSGIEAAVAAGKARVTGRRVMVGGQAATVAAACASLGLRAGYIGAFGSDPEGVLVRDTLAERRVDVSGATVSDASTRRAVILVDAGGRRTVLWHRSDRLAVAPSLVAPERLAARVVHVDDEDPGLALTAARAARSAGRIVTSDIEHAGDTAEALISVVTHPIFDQSLTAGLTGERDPERALRKLRPLNGGLMVTTLGEGGSAALEGDDFYTAPAFTVEAIDTTGAGDVFRAGFIYGLLQGWAVGRVLRFANAAAALACTRVGAMPSVPTLAEVEQFLSSRP